VTTVGYWAVDLASPTTVNWSTTSGPVVVFHWDTQAVAPPWSAGFVPPPAAALELERLVREGRKRTPAPKVGRHGFQQARLPCYRGARSR
jgi:hypothetical protein